MLKIGSLAGQVCYTAVLNLSYFLVEDGTRLALV